MFKKITTLVCLMLVLSVQAQDMKLYKHIVTHRSGRHVAFRGLHLREDFPIGH